MSIKRASKWIVPTALAFAVSTAWAGQITLYERPDFRGPSVVAVNPVDVVSRQGLGDTASSVVVTDGRWEVCTMEFFRGRCTELLPGKYPSLGVTLNGRIASAREVAYAAPPRTVFGSSGSCPMTDSTASRAPASPGSSRRSSCARNGTSRKPSISAMPSSGERRITLPAPHRGGGSRGR